MKRLAKTLLTFALAVTAGAAALLATGCSQEMAKDEAGGISSASDSATASNSNLVNPAQLPDSSFIYDASIKDLAKADSYMDGQTVQVVGEVVGDRIKSRLGDGYCWITLMALDGSNSEVSVYMSDSRAQAIDTFGAYGRRGTTLQVRGTFQLACADHEGISDIHASNVAVVSKGVVSPNEFDPDRFVPGILLVALGLGLVFLYRYLSEKRR